MLCCWRKCRPALKAADPGQLIHNAAVQQCCDNSHEYEMTGRRRPILIPQESGGRLGQFPVEQSGHGSGHHQQGPTQTNLGRVPRDSGICELHVVLLRASVAAEPRDRERGAQAPYIGCRFDAAPRIAYADPPAGAGKAIIKFWMPGCYQLRHGNEEKSRGCRRVMTPGQLARTITAQLSVNRDLSRSNGHIKGERADSRPMSGLNGISAALTP